MKPLRITVQLCSPLAVYDDYSPMLDGLLAGLWLDKHGLKNPNMTSSKRSIAELPLLKAELVGEPYWAVSSPHYRYTFAGQARYRKRWEPGDGLVSWGKRTPKWSISSGAEKNYDLPLPYRVTHTITWFAVGDKDAVSELLAGATSLGKKRADGFGFVETGRWSVMEIACDYHLVGPQGQLMRPVPTVLLDRMPEIRQRVTVAPCGFRTLDYAWRLPVRFSRVTCAVPASNAVMVKSLWQ